MAGQNQRNLDMEPVNWEPNSSIFESPQKNVVDMLM